MRYYLRVCLLLLIYDTVNAVRLRERRDLSQLKKNGKNVCEFDETNTIRKTMYTKVTETTDVEVCCRDFLFCWKTCKRTRVKEKTISKTVSSLQTYKVRHCCTGWTIGKTKEECDVPICFPPCKNGGFCKSPDTCQCKDGFEGDICQFDINECLPGREGHAKCQDNCNNIPGSYYCSCNKGFLPITNSTSCKDINECQTTPSPCQCAPGIKNCKKIAQCYNNAGSYSCQCAHGFRLARNNMCVDKNECFENENICPQACTNLIGSHKCTCFPGFKKDLRDTCVLEDKCRYQDGCEHQCVPIYAGKVCLCRKGFKLASDKHSCIDINECQLSNPCDLESSWCENFNGSYRCVCKPGFTQAYNGLLCLDRDECQEKTDRCLQKCINYKGGYKCGCNEGYKLAADKETCEDIDECKTKGRTYCYQRCINTVGSFVCACNHGYILGADNRTCYPRRCEPIVDPFYGRALCDGYIVGQKCYFNCADGFELHGLRERTCGADGRWSGEPTKCLPKKCPKEIPPPLNGKVTLPCDLSFGSTCPVTCLDGYILRGDPMIKCAFVYNRLEWDTRNVKCEEILVCKPSPCLNNGRCSIVTDTEYSCDCSNTGHVGKNCEKLLVEFSPIPKLLTNAVSPLLKISALPIATASVSINAEEPDVQFSPNKFSFSRMATENFYTLSSSKAGLFWTSFDVTSDEPVQPINDQLVFIFENNAVKSGSINLLSYDKQCYLLDVKTHSCSAVPIKLSSTSTWTSRHAGLFSTSGMIFMKIGSANFPVILPQINTMKLLQDIHPHSTFTEETPSSSQCQDQIVPPSFIQQVVLNDRFAKTFIQEFNKLTPYWFTINLKVGLKNIHEENIRTFIWSAQKVKSHPICGHAAIDETSTFLVYLHHENLYIQSYDKSVTMTTKSKFCLIVDICKQEPHLALPSDNNNHLESLFSLTNLQSMGWKVSLKSVGFRTSVNGDIRKCTKKGVKQLVFGSTAMTFDYDSSTVKGQIYGLLTYDIKNEFGKETVDVTSQCFDGKSRFDTLAWYSADTDQRKYVKKKTPHNEIRTSIKRQTPRKEMMRVIQSKNSVFKMKSGLRPILVKSPKSNAYLDFIFKESKSTSGGSGGSGSVDPSAVTLLEYPVIDLETYLEDLTTIITADPLKSTIDNFLTVVKDWNVRLLSDVSEIYGDKFDDNNFILKAIQYHFYKVGPAIDTLTSVITGVKLNPSVDPNTIQELENILKDFKSTYVKLKEHVGETKATKKLATLAAHFNSSMCLYLPCIEDVDVTLYPFAYDIGLGSLCRDPTKRDYQIWQTRGIFKQDEKAGEFFHFKKDDKINLCLTIDGVKKAKIEGAINIFGTQTRGVFLVNNNRISIPPTQVKLYKKYDFKVNATVDLALRSWNMVSMTTYGNATSSSKIVKDIEESLHDYAVNEYNRMKKREQNANEAEAKLRNRVASFTEAKKNNESIVLNYTQAFTKATQEHKDSVALAEIWRVKYEKRREKINKLESDLKKLCQIKKCERSCQNLKECGVCQDPYTMNVEVPSCKSVIKDRSYAFLKSEKSVCSHVVRDWKAKYTGNCKEPKPDATYASSVIKRLQEKIEKKEPLTIADAFELEQIDEKQGSKLRKTIEEKRFFEFLPIRLRNNLLTDQDFKKITEYKNKTFSDKLRRDMKKIKDSKTLQNIIKKMQEGQTLRNEDYAKLRNIDPQLEQKIRKSVEITEILERTRLLGNITEADIKKLEEIAPEYAKTFKNLTSNGEVINQILDKITKKLSNGTLGADDIAELEKVNPPMAEKLKAALKDQLSQKVKEMKEKLNSVKSTMEKGLNSTGFTDLQEQLNILSGSLKVYDENELKKLQEKILSNNKTSGSVFEELFERLDLGFDIKAMTGNSKDIDRSYNEFFNVLQKFDIPKILQRSKNEVKEGLTNVQDWFITASKIIKQSCDRCGENCTESDFKQVVRKFNEKMKIFEDKVCKTAWSVGSRTKHVSSVCLFISKLLNDLQSETACRIVRSKLIDPIKIIVDKWKQVRLDIEEMKNDKWKHSPTAINLLTSHLNFSSNLAAAYASELGPVKLTFMSRSDIVSKVGKNLAGKNASTNMAEMEVGSEVVKDVIQSIEKLPNLIKRNGKTYVDVSVTNRKAVTESFEEIFNMVVPLLQNVCVDRKPNVAMLAKLVAGAKAKLKTLLTAKDIKKLMLYTQMVGHYTKNVAITSNKEMGALIGCTLKRQAKSNETWSNEAIVSLKKFLTTVKPLEGKSIKDLANDIKSIIKQYSHNGLQSPIGKLLDLADNFVEESPSFNLPLMVSFPTKTSSIALNTFRDYLNINMEMIEGMKSIVEKCKGDDCGVDDIFGKERLSETFGRMESYLKVISQHSRKYLAKVKQFPQGLQMLTTSLEETQTSLKTLSESGTGFSVQGLEDIISAFRDSFDSVAYIKKNLKLNFEQLAGLKNKDIQKMIQTIEIFQDASQKLFDVSKISMVKKEVEALATIIKHLRLGVSTEDTNPFQRRLEVIVKVNSIIENFGKMFKELYTANLPSNIIYHIDKKFAPTVGRSLEDLVRILETFLKETSIMGEEIGMDFKLQSFGSSDLQTKVNDMVASLGSRKLQLADELSIASTKISKFFTKFSKEINEKIARFMGGIKKYKNQYQELRKKLKKYGDIFDEVEDTMTEIKRGPVSEIGRIKDSIEDLIESIKEYDIALILTADPETIPNKVKEMKQLFTSLSDSFKEIDAIMLKCKNCKVEKIFGYRFLKDSSSNVEKAFQNMSSKVENLASKVGDSIDEVQGVKQLVLGMKNKFVAIKEAGNFNLDTFKNLSKALSESTTDVTSIQKHAEKIGEILLDRDVDLEVVGGSIKRLVNLLSVIANKSHQVGNQGKKVLDKVLEMKKTFDNLKDKSKGIKNSPLETRLEIAKKLATDGKKLLKELPELFKFSKKTLEEVGIDTKWMMQLSGSIEKLTNTLVSSLDKTGQVLAVADITMTGLEQIKNQLPSFANSWKKVADASWDNKIPFLQKAFKNVNNVFETTIDTAIKASAAFNLSLTRSDLKSGLETVLGKERLEKYKNIFGNVSRMMNQLQRGPIPKIGTLTDAVDDYIDALDGYDFKKILLQDPENLRNKLIEFQQLATITGNVITEIGTIVGTCKTCDLSPIFGKRFVDNVSTKVKKKFSSVKEAFDNVGKRVDKGLQGWSTIIKTVNKISNQFKMVNKGLSRQSLDDIAIALKTSADIVLVLRNGTADIFKAIFDGNKEMEGLRFGFDKLVSQVSGVLNKSSIVLPQVGDIYDSVSTVKDTFKGIVENFENIQKGPIESRIKVLRDIGKGVNGIGKSLPIILNQSSNVLSTLGIDSAWLEKVSGSLVNVSNSLSKVVNQTDTVLTGAGVIVKDIRNMQGLASGIADDYQQILKSPWDQKFSILNQILGKADKIVGNVGHSAKIFDETIEDVFGVDIGVDESLTDLTNDVSGVIGDISNSLKKLSGVTKDITSTIDHIKAGPIEKIGKLTDSTKEFVDNLKNYDLAEILLLSPKFAKEKFGDLKEIISESGGILRNISQLVTKHCKSCGLDKIFGKYYSSTMVNKIGNSLRNISSKVEGILEKVGKGATNAAGIVNSVNGIKEEIEKLDDISFDEDGFDKIADVLSGTSKYIQDINNDTSEIFQLLFNGNNDLLKVTGRFESFVTDFGTILQGASNFSKNVADAFGEVNKIKETFKSTVKNIDDLTQGPIEHRVKAVKNIANGINSMMKAFPDLLSNPTLSPSWLRRFGSKFEGVTSGITSILNKTSEIADEVGETVKSVQAIGDTASIIGNEIKRLTGSGSFEGKLRIANNIVGKVKTLATQVNTVVNDATDVFETLSGKTFNKTDIFGKKTFSILSDISSGLNTVADRYTKFTELSKSLSEAFDMIDEDPVKFALEELPVIFNQTSKFVTLIFKDVKGIAGKLGVDLDKLNLDGKLVQSAKSFFKFTDTTLTAIKSGKNLIEDFKSLVNSKNFKEALSNFNNLANSGTEFLNNMDGLANTLIENWNGMKGDLSTTINKIAQSVGLNLKKMGSFLQKGLAVGKGVMNIASNIEQLLNMKEFDVETIVQAAHNIISIVESGVDIAKQFGLKLQVPGLENTATALGYVTAVVNIVKGVKDFMKWLDGVCDLTYQVYPLSRSVNYVCLLPRLQTENVKILMEECVTTNKTVIRGYGEAKICCLSKSCVYTEDPKCLYANENCSTIRQNFLNTTKLHSTPEQQETKRIFINYHLFSLEASAKEKDINTARINLYRAKIKLNRTIAGLKRSQYTLKMLKDSKYILKRQYQKLSSIMRGKRVLITIANVEFNFTHFKPSVRHLPLKITISDRNAELSYLGFSLDSQKMKESFDSIARTILMDELNYIALPNKRRRRSLSTNERSILGQKRNATYWSNTCTEFTNSFVLVKTIVKSLHQEVSSLPNQVSSDMQLSPIVQNLGEAAKQQSQTLRQIELVNQETSDSPEEMLQRWLRTSEGIMSEDIGAVCTGFKDCLEAQVSLLKGFYEPNMDGYDQARKAFDTLLNDIFALFSAPMTKDQIVKLKDGIQKSVTVIESNTYFCEKYPEMTKNMPLSKLAYRGEYFELECTIDGPAGMKYQWSKNGTIIPNQLQWKLSIEKMTLFDHGYYECSGHTLTGSITSNKVLVRVVEPIIFKQQPENIIIRYPGTSQIDMVCNATAFPISSYKWWFRPYTTTNKQLVSATAILRLKPVSSNNIGHYWCEVSNGQDTVSSRKAKLDIVRVMNRKESAKIHLHVTTEKKQWECQMPATNDSQTLTAIFEARFKSLFGASTTNTMKLTYKLTDENKDTGSFTIDFGVYDSRMSSNNQIGFAFTTSKQRAQLKSKVNGFVEGVDQINGLQVTWNECNYTSKIVKFGIDWQTEELACPRGMAASADKLYCEQCTPGTFDSGDGKCSLCPQGSYQPSAGQHFCIPCGVDQRTEEEGATIKQQCKPETFICKESIKMVILLDSSNSVDITTWSSLKTFASKYVLNWDSEVVDIDVVVFGDRVKLIDVDENIKKINKVSGHRRMDLALAVARKSLETTSNSFRKVVVILTSPDNQNTSQFDDSKLILQAKEMQFSGIEMYTMLVGEESSQVEDGYIKLASKPSGRYAFKSSPNELTKWSTIFARSVCRSD